MCAHKTKKYGYRHLWTIPYNIMLFITLVYTFESLFFDNAFDSVGKPLVSWLSWCHQPIFYGDCFKKLVCFITENILFSPMKKLSFMVSSPWLVGWIDTWSLVVDELDLDGFHGGHSKDGLTNSGAQTAQQPDQHEQVLLLY